MNEAGGNGAGVGIVTSPVEQVKTLIAAHRDGELPLDAISHTDDTQLQTVLQPYHIKEITYPLIAAFKSEVDLLVRSDAREAVQVATLAEALSKHAKDIPARALGSRTKGMALHTQARYADAVVQYQVARRLYDQAGQQVEKARVERAMVDALIYLGKYDEALIVAQAARKVLVKNQEVRLLAQLESNVGNIFHRLDRNREALDCYLRASTYFTEVDDQFGLALTSYNRANVHCNLDEFREAHELYQQSLTLHEKEENEPGALHARYSIGYLHFLRGAYHQALRTMHETREIALKIGDDHTAALCILDLAEIYLQLDALGEAEQLGSEARALFQNLGMRYEAARAATFVGISHLRQNNLEAATVSFQQAHDEFVAEGNAVHLGVVQLYRAETALAQGEITKASELSDAAAELFTEQQLRAKECMALLIKARATLAEGQPARYLCETIWAICKELEMPWLHAQAAETLGDAYLAENDRRAAQKYYAAAIASIEQIRSQIRVDEFRSTFFSNKFGVYEKLVRLCLEEEDPATAFYYLESSKARGLMDLLVNDLEMSAAEEKGEASEQSLIEQWHHLREELHWHHNKLRKAEAQGQSRTPATEQKLRDEIKRCESAFAEITRTLHGTDPEFLLQRSSGVNAADLRKILAPDEVVIKYHNDDQHMRIFVISQSGLQVVSSPVSLAELHESLRGWSSLLDKFHGGTSYLAKGSERWQADTLIYLHQLWRALYEPIAHLMKDKHLIFIPSDILYNIPFQALYDGQRYLLEDHEITQVPSIRLLQQCASHNVQTKGSVAIFGTAEQTANEVSSEIKAIRKIYPKADCFVGEQVTASAFENYAPGNGILHIATQLVVRRDNPFFSTFLLSDAAMNLYELGRIKLPAALVTLTGCKTSLSRNYAGDEIMGLAQGFLNTGAGGLIVNLWPVNGAATEPMMNAFYQFVKEGVSLRKAIRLAALEAKKQHSHPYHWAPFILISHQNSKPVILSE